LSKQQTFNSKEADMTSRHTLFALVAAVTLAAAAPLHAAEHPNFSGTWKMNESARQPDSTGPREVVLTIEHKDPSFRYEAKGRQSNYAAFSEEYSFTTDGKVPAGDAKVKVVAQWDEDVLITRYLVGGNEMFVVRYQLSADGKQLTREQTMRGKRVALDTYDRK
jgi:hypothetical protein